MIMKYTYQLSFIIIVLLATSFSQIKAQKLSWRDQSDIAEKALKVGDYATAAKNFKLAWQQKKSKYDLLYKAGKCAYLMKDYKNAAFAFGTLLKKTKKFPDVKFQNARALKSLGKYSEAKSGFEEFIKFYTAEDKPQMSELVNREIAGCMLALEPKLANNDVTINYPGLVVNTNQSDFAPVPFGDNALYFSSNRKGLAKIYRSEKSNSGYSKPQIPTIFPKNDKVNYANGSFSDDFKRFYFNICVPTEMEGGLQSRCDIYVMLKKDEVWGAPIKLRGYINDSLATNTHPCLVMTDTKEILYFASNRKGGLGGTDIWYSERSLSTDDVDFTVPRNCGDKINTLGDEKSPWYNSQESSLYFSSNGFPSLGGLDIFKSNGQHRDFSEAMNLGEPFNSPADDLYYIQRKGLNTGYLVSNRTFTTLKNTTTDEDIFEFNTANPNNFISGKILDKYSEKGISDSRVSVYELAADGKETLIDTRFCPDGSFNFSLAPSRKYKVKAEAKDYSPDYSNLETNEIRGNRISRNFVLSKNLNEMVSIGEPDFDKEPEPVIVEEANSKPKAKKDPKQKEPVKKVEVIAESIPTTGPSWVGGLRPDGFYREGEYYLIQLLAAKRVDGTLSVFNNLDGVGTLTYEPVPNKPMDRVLLAWWPDRTSGNQALLKIRKAGFKTAFLTKYQSGIRQ